MDKKQRQFLDELLGTPGPAGSEAHVQRVFTDYVEGFADDVRTDAYGNAVAVSHGSGDGPTIAFAGHADEIGFIVKEIDDRGHLRLAKIGSPNVHVSEGRHVEVHTADGSVPGVIGAKPAHLRTDDEGVEDVSDLHVEIGAEDRSDAAEIVDVGDPITVARHHAELRNDRLAAPAMDNRTGVWSAAEGMRRAVEAGTDATVYAVSTVQEEIGKGGARMIGGQIQPDAAIAIDVTFATDSPDVDSGGNGDIDLGGGPAVARGGINHPAVVDTLRVAATDVDIAVQFEALGARTSTDADALFEQGVGVPTGLVSVPSRYMHSPVEVVDLADLDATADLLSAFAVRAPEDAPFAIEV